MHLALNGAETVDSQSEVKHFKKPHGLVCPPLAGIQASFCGSPGPWPHGPCYTALSLIALVSPSVRRRESLLKPLQMMLSTSLLCFMFL